MAAQTADQVLAKGDRTQSTDAVQVAQLCFAAASGDKAKVQKILDKGVDVNASDYDQRTALHIAAADGHKEVLEFLISSKANVNATDRWGHSALDEARRNNFEEVSNFLISKRAIDSATPAEHRTQTEQSDAAIRNASKLSAGEREHTPQFERAAAELKSLSKEHSGKSLGDSAAARASHSVKSAEITAAVLLCRAAAVGDLNELKELGEDPNSADYDGRTPLHVAASHGHVEIVEWLISRRANVNQLDSFGLSALTEATRHNQQDVIPILIHAGADPSTSKLCEVKLMATSGAWAIPASEIHIGKALTSTLKSTIYLATWRGTQVIAKTSGALRASADGRSLVELAAEKVGGTQEHSIASDDAVTMAQEVVHEVQMLSTLRHPDLVMFLGACFDQKAPYFITEFMEGGDLERHFISQAKKAGKNYQPPRSTLTKWSSGVARALGYLHGHTPQIIHRDMKPMNLLLTRNAEELKVTDFGISKFVERCPEAPYMSGGVGTWRYMAPEVARHEVYSDRADIFSFALIMWFMCTGRQPFVEQFGKNAETILREYCKGNHPRPRLKGMCCGKEYRSLVEDCWKPDPSQRPTAEQVASRLTSIASSDEDDTAKAVSCGPRIFAKFLPRSR